MPGLVSGRVAGLLPGLTASGLAGLVEGRFDTDGPGLDELPPYMGREGLVCVTTSPLWL